MGESFGKVLLAQKVMDCITCRGNSSPFALLAVAEAVVVVVVAVVVVVVVAAAAVVVVARGLGIFSSLGLLLSSKFKRVAEAELRGGVLWRERIPERIICVPDVSHERVVYALGDVGLDERRRHGRARPDADENVVP